MSKSKVYTRSSWRQARCDNIPELQNSCSAWIIFGQDNCSTQPLKIRNSSATTSPNTRFPVLQSISSMDPLGFTASINAVLQAADAVISICSDYSAAIKNSSWELPRVTEEVKSLRNILEHLAKKVESVDLASKTQLPTLKLLCEPDGGQLAMCLVELKALEKKLAPPSWGGQVGSKRRAFIQACLGWPMKKGDTRKTLESIERFKATLNLAITADQM
jgi:hypothetical protein